MDEKRLQEIEHSWRNDGVGADMAGVTELVAEVRRLRGRSRQLRELRGRCQHDWRRGVDHEYCDRCLTTKDAQPGDVGYEDLAR